jgi:hypothetical protein
MSLVYSHCLESPVYLADFLCYCGSPRGTVVVVKSTWWLWEENNLACATCRAGSSEMRTTITCIYVCLARKKTRILHWSMNLHCTPRWTTVDPTKHQPEPLSLLRNWSGKAENRIQADYGWDVDSSIAEREGIGVEIRRLTPYLCIVHVVLGASLGWLDVTTSLTPTVLSSVPIERKARWQSWCEKKNISSAHSIIYLFNFYILQ